jgi:hypothetical protein
MATILIVFIMFGTAFLGLAAEPGEDSRGEGDRSTPIDGFHKDEFNTAGNVTLYEDATVEDGEMTIDRVLVRDEFDRGQIPPWQAVEGTPRLVGQTLETNGTENDTCTAGLNIDLHDLQIDFEVAPGIMMARGPVIGLRGSSEDHVVFWYNAFESWIGIGNITGLEWNLHQSMALTLIEDEWVNARIVVDGDELTFTLGAVTVFTTMSLTGNFTSLELGSQFFESSAWDNVTISKIGGSGWAVTDPVDLPTDTDWDILTVNKITPVGTSVTFTILDGATGQPIPGLEDVTKAQMSVSGLIDPINNTSIQLKLIMSADGTDEPLVNSWKISWLGDPPMFIKPIPDLTVDEDNPPAEGLLDLREHFVDRFTDSDNLTFSPSYVSDALHAKPVIDGYMLNFELPTKDWHGSVTYKISCSDGTLSVETPVEATVIVSPVDDPPLMRPVSRINMLEDTVYILDLTSYLEDVDTAVEKLTIRALSPHVQVLGRELRIFYSTGGVNEQIELEISDHHNAVAAFIEVEVTEVDDAPVFEPIKDVKMIEDDERTIDIEDLISDEDTIFEELTITILDADEFVSIDGTEITLFYPTGGGEFVYTVQVSDASSTVTQNLTVEVTDVNDNPKIASVGDLIPVDGEISVNVTEGNELRVPITVEDEESTSFQFTLVSEFDGVRVYGGEFIVETKIGEIGEYELQILVSDGGASDMLIVHLEILNRNDAPRDVAITSPENGSSIKQSESVQLRAYAIDPDIIFGDVLTFQWSSDIDGDLGSGRNKEVQNLSLGIHKIILHVSDGQITNETWVRLTVKEDGGGGNGGKNGPGKNGDDGGGISTGLAIGVIAALVVVGGLLFFMSKRKSSWEENPYETSGGPLPVLEETKEVKAKPAPAPKVVATEAAGTTEEAEPAEAEEPGPLPELESEPELEPEPEVEPEPEPEPAPEIPEVPYAIAHTPEPDKEVGQIVMEAHLLEKPVISAEEKVMDELKRTYQNAIGTLPFGIPSSELASRSWVDLASALATGEKRTLDDGREVTDIDGRWYYSDPEDVRTLLKEHVDEGSSKQADADSDMAERLEKLEERFSKGEISEVLYERLKKKYGG